jgi:hypothetical protein
MKITELKQIVRSLVQEGLTDSRMSQEQIKDQIEIAEDQLDSINSQLHAAKHGRLSKNIPPNAELAESLQKDKQKLISKIIKLQRRLTTKAFDMDELKQILDSLGIPPAQRLHDILELGYANYKLRGYAWDDVNPKIMYLKNISNKKFYALVKAISKADIAIDTITEPEKSYGIGQQGIIKFK